MEKNFCSTNGIVQFAGIHLIIELWKAKNLSSLRRAVRSRSEYHDRHQHDENV